ncbi:hypothetical protein ACJIZ3_019272 [Penstemon smallii]|uniref:RING-type domain-containing protein n=1 Tax=Penstemon smallii TaxID=265156 RepID=A0ABD3T1N2_9LAMI
MGTLDKLFAQPRKTLQFFFSTIIPKVLILAVIITCIMWKYYKRIRFHYKYRSLIDTKSSKFVCRRDILNACSSECVICLSEISDGEVVREIHECKHSFHGNCLDQWLRCEGAATCPLCRRVVLPLDMVEEYERMQKQGENNVFEIELALFFLSTLQHRRCNEFS